MVAGSVRHAMLVPTAVLSRKTEKHFSVRKLRAGVRQIIRKGTASMSLYKEFLELGYSESEANELSHLAKLGDYPVADIELDEATKIVIDKFNELGCTSFRMNADELAKIYERLTL